MVPKQSAIKEIQAIGLGGSVGWAAFWSIGIAHPHFKLLISHLCDRWGSVLIAATPLIN